MRPHKQVLKHLAELDNIDQNASQKMKNQLVQAARQCCDIILCVEDREKFKKQVLEQSIEKLTPNQENLKNPEEFKQQLRSCAHLWSPEKCIPVDYTQMSNILMLHFKENHFDQFVKKAFPNASLESKNQALIDNPNILEIIGPFKQKELLHDNLKNPSKFLEQTNKLLILDPKIFGNMNKDDQIIFIQENITNPKRNSKSALKILNQYLKLVDSTSRKQFLKDVMKPLSGENIAKAIKNIPESAALILDGAQSMRKKNSLPHSLFCIK